MCFHLNNFRSNGFRLLVFFLGHLKSSLKIKGLYLMYHLHLLNFRKECNANDMNRNGWSALMYACYMGHDVTSQCLMRAGADLSMTSQQGSSPLILASMCGNDNIIKILLQPEVSLEIFLPSPSIS